MPVYGKPQRACHIGRAGVLLHPMEQGLLGVALVTLAVVALICVSILARVTMRVVDTMTALADKEASAQVLEARPPSSVWRRPEHPPLPAETIADMHTAGTAGWSPEFAKDLHDISEPPSNGRGV